MAVTFGRVVGRETIDARDLKRRTDLLALIGRDTALKKVATTRGGEYAGACPFCGGRDRLRVQPARGLWWCRQCGGDRWQDPIAYVMRRDGSTFPEACAELGGAAAPPRALRPTSATTTTELSVVTEEPSAAWRAQAAVFVARAESALWSDVGVKAREWLQARGLTDDTIRRYRLGYQPAAAWDDPGTWGLDGDKHIWRPRGIVIPWQLDGQLWQVKIRRPEGDPRYLSIRGGHPLLFGGEMLPGHDTAVLTEGEFDAMLLEQEAGDLVGAATLGSCSKGLDGRVVERLLPVARLLLAYDTDADGEKGATRLGALSARARRVRVPLGKDVTEFWQVGGSIQAWIRFELAKLGAKAAGPPTAPMTVAAPVVTARPPMTHDIAIRWGRERGWLAVRDPWGDWHEIPARDAPRAWRVERRAGSGEAKLVDSWRRMAERQR